MNVKAVVLGTFKAKDEIDLAIQELNDLKVKVLAPEQGGLSKSEFTGFYPLASERTFDPGDVETHFLAHVSQADFVYLIDPNGYVGTTVSMELGYCIGKLIPIYCKYPVDSGLDRDPAWEERISLFSVTTIEEAVRRVTREEKILRPNILETAVYSRR